MKLRLLSLSVVLCFSILITGARVGAAQEVQPLEPEWLRQMYDEGWQKLQEGVLQRETGESRFETFTYGEEGWRWLVQSYESRAADLQSLHDASPSAELARVIDRIEEEIDRLNGILLGAPSAEAFDGESLQACLPAFGGQSSAGPLTGTVQGITASAAAFFHDDCGALGDTFATALARATIGSTQTTNTQDDLKNSGSRLDSTATATMQGSTDCYSYAQASVTSAERNISFSTPLAESFSCTRPLALGGRSADVGAVGLAGSTSFNNGTYTLQAGGSDVWETADAFHFAYQELTGDGEIVARLASLTQPAGANWSTAAVMMREDLTADSIHASLMITTTGKAKLRRRLTKGGTTLSDGPTTGTTAVPQWLKLIRSGDSFSAFLSADGVTWTQVHTAETVPMARTIRVGLLALRNGGTQAATAVFDNVSVRSQPSPWRGGDVGAVGLSGSSTAANGTFTLQAGGTDLWDIADAFHYVYQPMSGDGEIVAEVTGLTLPTGASWSTAAVMMRERLTEGSLHASMMITTDGKAKFRRRTTVGGITASDGPSAGTTYAPRWLKLNRAGNTFTAYLSTNGTAWTQVHTAQTIVMPADIWVGLAALRSGSTAGTATVTFRNVTVVP